MANLHLVTGYAGQAHVTAADDGSLFEAAIRSGQFVTEAGQKFSASVVSNNQIRVYDGELIMQGRHVKLDPGAYVDLAIENGAQGRLRNDLIVARYTKNADNGIEECNLVVIKGTAAESSPADPECTTGSINADGDILHDFPLYRVPLSGLNVGVLVALFTPVASLDKEKLSTTGGSMTGPLSMTGNKVTNLGTPTSNTDAATKQYADAAASRASSPRNLLDNSDFTDPVNQRGSTSYENKTNSWQYTIDRWKCYNGSLTIADGYINWDTNTDAVYKRLAQPLEKPLKAGATYTLALLARVNRVGGIATVRLSEGTANISGASSTKFTDATAGFEWFLCSFTPSADVATPCFELLTQNTSDSFINIDIKYAALYEGKYTVDTLPAYAPKGYGTELLECQRYYVPVFNWQHGSKPTGDSFGISIATPVPMRRIPTIIVKDSFSLFTSSGWTALTLNAVRYEYANMYRVICTLESSITDGIDYLVQGISALSADL